MTEYDTLIVGSGVAGLRAALEGNIRRIEWGKWYEKGERTKKTKFLRWAISRWEKWYEKAKKTKLFRWAVSLWGKWNEKIKKSRFRNIKHSKT